MIMKSKKELYIRVGNSEETKNILIIGDETGMGERDISGYRPSKGAIFNPLVKTDPFSGNVNLTYIHATPNIKLDTSKYSRDYDVHAFIKEYCKDLVKWDGETDKGIVRSREAFIIKGDRDETIKKLYERLEQEIHGIVPSCSILMAKIGHSVGRAVSKTAKKTGKKMLKGLKKAIFG